MEHTPAPFPLNAFTRGNARATCDAWDPGRRLHQAVAETYGDTQAHAAFTPVLRAPSPRDSTRTQRSKLSPRRKCRLMRAAPVGRWIWHLGRALCTVACALSAVSTRVGPWSVGGCRCVGRVGPSIAGRASEVENTRVETTRDERESGSTHDQTKKSFVLDFRLPTVCGLPPFLC